MIKSYKTVLRGGEAEIVEKKSRFIAAAEHVETEEEAAAFINGVLGAVAREKQEKDETDA